MRLVFEAFHHINNNWSNLKQRRKQCSSHEPTTDKSKQHGVDQSVWTENHVAKCSESGQVGKVYRCRQFQKMSAALRISACCLFLYNEEVGVALGISFGFNLFRCGYCGPTGSGLDIIREIGRHMQTTSGEHRKTDVLLKHLQPELQWSHDILRNEASFARHFLYPGLI